MKGFQVSILKLSPEIFLSSTWKIFEANLQEISKGIPYIFWWDHWRIFWRSMYKYCMKLFRNHWSKSCWNWKYPFKNMWRNMFNKLRGKIWSNFSRNSWRSFWTYLWKDNWKIAFWEKIWRIAWSNIRRNTWRKILKSSPP